MKIGNYEGLSDAEQWLFLHLIGSVPQEILWPKDRPEGFTPDVQILVNDHEVDLNAFVTRASILIDSTIEREIEKGVKSRFASRYSEVVDLFDELKDAPDDKIAALEEVSDE